MSRKGWRKPILFTLLEGYDIDEKGCWVWRGSKQRSGYGHIIYHRLSEEDPYRHFLVHRLSHEFFKGPIPKGYEVDHLCNVPSCMNPEHLEAVTPHENWNRSNNVSRVNRDKTNCKYGHELTSDNVYSPPSGYGRWCKICRRHYDKNIRPSRSRQEKEKVKS